MFRRTSLFCSMALSRKGLTPFSKQALTLSELHMKHRDCLESGFDEEARSIEDDFLREWEKTRPMCTATAHLEVGKFYTVKLFKALKHFGVDQSDPTYGLLARTLGNHLLRGSASLVKTMPGRKADESLIDQKGGKLPQQDAMQNVDWAPEEFPPPQRNNLQQGYDSKQIRVKDDWRGHWVLREKELAMTKEDREFDPW